MMDISDKRQSKRIAASKTLKIKPCGIQDEGALLVTLISVNFSENGLLFESTQPYDIGKPYTIRFTGKDNKLYDTRIEIIRVKEVLTHTQYQIGAKFLDTDSEKLRQLLN